MSDVVVRVENLSKRYRIGAAQRRHDMLRDALAERLRGSSTRGATSTVWALEDVSFEVRRGEVVGLIGRNGAGKSTLLKILSRITEPTSGRAEICGRVGSLLEVGTGFHPELTGRENIFLNGAILGMKRAEIAARFDEIVAFSEIERFLDTPVKRYSSGMYVRLAFAVAAHLEPEILLVDEVLAVGDISFQQKCLGKMGTAAREGRTVLFVSHNMGAVRRLCSDAVLLDGGRAQLRGPAETAIKAYLQQSANAGHWIRFAEDLSKDAQIMALSAGDGSEDAGAAYPHTFPIHLTLEYAVRRWPSGSYVCVDIFNESGVRLLWASDPSTPEGMLAPSRSRRLSGADRHPRRNTGAGRVPGHGRDLCPWPRLC